MKFQTQFNNQTLEFDVSQDSHGITVKMENQQLKADFIQLTSNSYSLLLDGHSHFLHITGEDGRLEVTVDQHTNQITVLDETQILLEQIGMADIDEEGLGVVHAPIPGLVTQILVSVGDKIRKGDKVCILEAMKMENEIFAPVDGILKIIHTSAGNALEKGDIILEIADSME